MKSNTKTIVNAAVLLAIALVFQLVKMGQFFTGTGINTVLLLAASLCGFFWAAAIGCITPIMAVLLGVHPPVLIPLVPYIIAANIVFVLIFWLFSKKNIYVGAITAAIVKFAFLYLFVNFFAKLIVAKPIPAPIKLALSFPQLITALAGGVLAIIVLKALKKSQV